ncbi:MFS general substrate transporter [Amylocystis lapponica]|nr:MFS general substrate transporter [Amylocystis lapponica]
MSASVVVDLRAPGSPIAEILETSSQTSTIHDGDDVNSEFEREVYGPQLADKEQDQFEVTISREDPAHPHNWPTLKKVYITILGSLLVFNATFASSLPSGQVPAMMEYFTFSREVATLTISLFVAGYCVGPLVWGPLSEQYGRKAVFVGTFFPYVCFQIGCALSKNTGSILIFRFIGGTFAACPLANSGALLSDIWDPGARGKAMAFFTLAPFAGPTLAPICSGWMAVAGVSWRWNFWLLTCFTGAFLALIVLTLPETYLPILTVRRAQQKRKETGDSRYWAPMERNELPLKARIQTTLGRPFKMLFQEPMLLAICFYMSFVYGVLYLLLEAYPIVFTIGHGFNAGVTGLMFLPIFLGGVAAVLMYLFIFNPRYERKMAECAPHPVPPEARLEIAMWAAPVLVISFFWFGWTSYPRISFWAPMMAGAPLGWATICIFLAFFNYMVDAYLFVAASALSVNTVTRSCFGAGFPLFATQMYDTLDPRWASTLLGCIAVVLGPIPFVLNHLGPTLRRRSKYAPSGPAPLKVVEVADSV